LEALELLGPLRCSYLSLSGPACRQWSRSVQVSQHARPAFNPIPDSHFNGCGGIQQDIDTRAELDQADALSPFHWVADLLGKHNPTCQQACDLFENYGPPFTFDGYHILLVLLGRRRIHGINELPLLISNRAYDAANRRPIYVHVKDI
jgi:hypothetical protein